MGASSWSDSDFTSYTISKGYTVTNSATTGYTKLCLDYLSDASQMYTSCSVDPILNPMNVMRECRDSEEHPNTVSVILAIDETGSMSDCLMEVASSLNEIISKLYETVDDLEICVMGIGDLAYDHGAIQIGQFESDIRIAEQLDKIWFEKGGGGNSYESYTAAWYMAARHTDLDCWKRGKKGIIITLGDEMINPYLPKDALQRLTGDALQSDIETGDLYLEVSQKYDVYHIFVDHNRYTHMRAGTDSETFKDVIGDDHVYIANVNQISDTIIGIVSDQINSRSSGSKSFVSDSGNISW